MAAPFHGRPGSAKKKRAVLFCLCRAVVCARRMLSKAEINRLRSLRDKKHRDEAGYFAIEGEKVVAELLAARHPLLELYTTPAWPTSTFPPAHKPPAIYNISMEEMARISHFPTPSTVFAVGQIERAVLDPSSLNHGFTLLLDGIQDAGNLGTLLRIADWFAFDRVVASSDSVDVFNQKVINASMGSFSRVKFFTADLPLALSQVTAPILGCDLIGEDVHTLPPLRNAVVAIGSEGHGLSPQLRQRVSRFITIPRYGAAESLNAAVAAAVVCDNLRRNSGHNQART
jgi:TrmH family RNA methyltransferase